MCIGAGLEGRCDTLVSAVLMVSFLFLVFLGFFLGGGVVCCFHVNMAACRNHGWIAAGASCRGSIMKKLCLLFEQGKGRRIVAGAICLFGCEALLNEINSRHEPSAVSDNTGIKDGTCRVSADGTMLQERPDAAQASHYATYSVHYFRLLDLYYMTVPWPVVES
jgi:hypothetical protein